jgi:transposase
MIEGVIAVRRIFLYRGICDMRRSFDRLARMVDEQLQHDPLSGDVYVFINRDSRRLKALYWDQDGYVLWYKRLEQGQFIIPGGDGIEIDRTAWVHMLEGIDVQVTRRQPRYGRDKKLK